MLMALCVVFFSHLTTQLLACFSAPNGLNRSIIAGARKKSARSAQIMAKPAINPKSPMLLMSERAKIENPAASVMVVKAIGRPTVKSVSFSAPS